MDGALGRAKSNLYTRRHYIEIGGLLKETNANPEIVNRYVEKFKADNPRFNEARFREYLQTGVDKRLKKWRTTQ